MKKIISFDMDGTLFDKNFDDLLWFTEMPKLYSKKHKISFEGARRKCLEEYDKESKFSTRWYDIKHWLSHFQLDHPWEKIVGDLKHTVNIYDDAIPALKSLGKKYRLVLLSTATRDFINLKMGVENISKYFCKIYSTTTDLGASGKSKMVYRKLMSVLNVKPEQLVHVGDDEDFDFKIPRKMGITAYLLDRKRKGKKGEFVVHSLKELEEKLL